MGICVMEPFLPSTRPARYDLMKTTYQSVIYQSLGNQIGKIY